MKRLEPKIQIDDGWMVQVYGRDRRLLCVLEPSHGWIFLAGCSLGLIFAVAFFNLGRYSPPLEPPPSTEVPYLQVD